MKRSVASTFIDVILLFKPPEAPPVVFLLMAVLLVAVLLAEALLTQRSEARCEAFSKKIILFNFADKEWSGLYT